MSSQPRRWRSTGDAAGGCRGALPGAGEQEQAERRKYVLSTSVDRESAPTDERRRQGLAGKKHMA
eukprot:12902721-Prorocentrum_lima.AAC.1